MAKLNASSLRVIIVEQVEYLLLGKGKRKASNSNSYADLWIHFLVDLIKLMLLPMVSLEALMRIILSTLIV